ncbi:MAG: RNA 2',3'-cyclic phosphodiesterase [Alphaproteobacteria bacterium]|jgi:2'-5' RNA ligase|nr:RNA 2',3'-cyclic phosphodiesterase [Alphaproteobacteria bacterium]MDP7221833.1 RNA 2',3'-cyclic phosphodiesterase [Alphaproteobacteria bacterium]
MSSENESSPSSSAEKTRRVFVALPVGDGLRSCYDALPKTGVGDARWNHVSDLHITVRFLGDLPCDEVDAVRDHLGRVKCQSFGLEVSGFGVFDNKQAVLYADVKSTRKMNNLVASVNETLQPLGFAMPLRPYVPHVTLLRTPQKRVLDQYIKKNTSKMRAQWTAQYFSLMESGNHDENGRVYTEIQRYPMR